MRAIAVLSVVGFHSFPTWLPGGFIGVDIFFVISGFLISSIILTKLNDKTLSLKEFYARRVKRIFPALLLVLTATCTAAWFLLLSGELKQLAMHVSAGAAFASNLLLWKESGYFDAAAETKPLLHLWSLGVEEQFYLIWPLALWATLKRGLSAWIPISLIFAASLLLCLDKTNLDPAQAFYSPVTRFWELLIGSALAHFIIAYPQHFAWARTRFAHTSAIAGFTLLALGLATISRLSPFPGWRALLPTMAAALLIFAGPKPCLSRIILTNRLATWLGLISFPLYLWHWPFLAIARILEDSTPDRYIRILIPTSSVILAWLTYQYIERPIRRSASKSYVVTTLSIIMVGFLCIGQICYFAKGFPERQVAIANANSDALEVPAQMRPEPCLFAQVSPEVLENCKIYSPKSPVRRVVIWGDSSVDAWSPVFFKIADDKHYELVLLSFHSCPPLIGAKKTTIWFPKLRTYCGDGLTQEATIRLIRSLTPFKIFLIANWNSYSPVTNREFVTDGPELVATQATTTRTIIREVPETIRALDAISQTVVFRSWPILPDRPYESRPILDILRRRPHPMTFDASIFRMDSELINSVLNSLRLKQTEFFDPSLAVCDRVCSTYLDGIRLYSDGYHITPKGSMLFEGKITKLL